MLDLNPRDTATVDIAASLHTWAFWFALKKECPSRHVVCTIDGAYAICYEQSPCYFQVQSPGPTYCGYGEYAQKLLNILF